MPRVVIQTGTSVRSRCAELLLGGSLYQTTMIPYLDVEKDVTALEPMGNAIQIENVLPDPEQEELEKRIREEVEENVASWDGVSSDLETLCTEDETTARAKLTSHVTVPNMETEVSTFFARARIMPPPPPAHVMTMAPLRFWYTRLLSDEALYQSCNAMAGFALAPLPALESSCAEITLDVSQWVVHANQWWTALSNAMSTNGLGCNVPLQMRWNPYSVALTRRYTAVRGTSAVVTPSTEAAVRFSRFPPPPPPAYAVLFAEMTLAAADATEAERMAQDYVKSWWRSATQWAAAVATNKANAWICPPPTTAETTEAWVDECGRWCTYVAKQLQAGHKPEKRHRKQ